MSVGLLSRINKWRRSLGYGVHSPLAFRIVKECLYSDPEYGLYSDSFVDFEYHEDREMRRNTKRLLRLINLLRPKSVWAPGADRKMMEAIGISFPGLQASAETHPPKDTDFIVLRGTPEIEEEWEKMNGREECVMVCFDMRKESIFPEITDATLIMKGKNYCIFLRKRGMQRTEYELL